MDLAVTLAHADTASSIEIPPPARGRLTQRRLLCETPRYTLDNAQWSTAGGEQPCIVKAVRADRPSAAAAASLRAEAQLLSVLHGVAGVPRVLHAEPHGAELVLTRAPGANLYAAPEALLREVPRSLRLGIALARVLGSVHAERIVHGDLSPANVMLDPATGIVTLIDFGDAIAQSHVSLDFTHAARLARTLPFSAPEQTGRLGRGADYRADLYALGAVLYWALTGRTPLPHGDPLELLHALLTQAPEPPERFNPQVPPMLSAIVLKLLAKAPEARYQSADGLADDLQRCLDGEREFVLGRGDHRVLPAQPSRLFGREAQLAQLAGLLLSTGTGPRVALVRGFSGAGKSSLVRALVPALSGCEGIFAGGRYDEFQRLQPYSGIVDALAELANYWLAEPQAVLAGLRAELLARLGSHAALLAQFVPAFSRVLWPEGAPDAGADAQQGNETLDAGLWLRHAVGAVLASARTRGVPIVFFLDNLQWADLGSLELFEHLVREHGASPLLLVGVYRDNEVDAGHPLGSVLLRWRETGVELVDVVVDDLEPAAVSALVADVLVGPPADANADADVRESLERLAPLAQGLHRRTGGNPFFVLQYLQQLLDDARLRMRAGRWQWDAEALDALPGSDNLVAGLVAQFQRMPPRTRQLACGCACAGGLIDLDTIADVLGEAPRQVDAWLLPLLRRDVLLPVASADSQAGSRSRRLRFCHDRMQAAALDSLQPAERAQWHLLLARALHGRGAAHAGPRFAAAQHYIDALDLVADGECTAVIELLAGVAHAALRTGSFEKAWRFVEAALALEPRSPLPPVDRLRLDVLAHRVLCGMGRDEEADTCFEALATRFELDRALVGEAVSRQCALLGSRLLLTESTALALTYAARLGLDVPADDALEEAASGEQLALYALLQKEGVEVFERLEPMRDDTIRMTAMLLGRAATNSLRWSRRHWLWCSLRGVRLAVEHGAHVDLPTVVNGAAGCLDTERDDHHLLAYRLVKVALRLLGPDADPVRTARTRQLATTTGLCWFEPLPQLIEYLRPNFRAFVEAGDREFLPYYTIPNTEMILETAPTLDEFAVELEAALAPSEAWGDHWGAAMLQPYRQFIAAMRGQTRSPGSFENAAFDEAAFLAGYGNSMRGPMRYGTQRAISAALFGDWTAALHYLRLADATNGLRGRTHLDALARWTLALALGKALLGAAGPVADREAMRRELAAVVAWLGRCAACSTENFMHMHRLAVAIEAWAAGDLLAAVPAFAASIAAARLHRRPYHLALACELAAEFDEAHGLDPGPHRLAALAAYEHWGAEAKAALLRQAIGARPTAAPAEPAVAASPAAAPPMPLSLSLSTGPLGIDVIGITQAAQQLALERNPEKLPGLLFDLVRRYAAAERGLLLWREGPRWRPGAGFDGSQQWVDFALGEAEAAARTAMLPPSVHNFLVQAQQPVLLPDVASDPRFGRDPRVREQGIQSIVGLPIQLRGETVGLLYLDNLRARTLLGAQQIDTLRLIGLQFAVAYENARVHRGLEALVAERTAEIQHERRLLQMVLDGSPAAIALEDAGGRFLLANSRYAEIVGRAGETLQGLHVADVWPEPVARHDREQAGRALAEGRRLREEAWLPVNGTPRVHQVHRFPLLDEQGAPYAVGIIAIDVTQLHQARAAAESATEAKSLFLANMSHEIRTPMNAILGIAHLALEAEGLTPRHAHYVRNIERSARTLLGVINDILDFSKIEAGKLAIERAEFLPADVIAQLASVVGLQADAKGLALVFDEPAGLPGRLVGDPLRLVQVLLNLCSNAVKFTERGSVRVGIEVLARDAAGVRLRFSVADTGVGLSPTQQQRLFVPFEQAEVSTARRHGGTGLGLAISRRLVELMGGTIGLQSTPGQGSRFHFELPFPLPADGGTEAAAGWGGGRRLLVVDDQPVTREALCATALGLGLQAEGAADAWEAMRLAMLAQAAGTPYDAVLLAVELPGIDGLGSAQELAQAGCEGPFVLVAGPAAAAQALSQAQRLPGRSQELLTRPVTRAALREVLARIVFGEAADGPDGAAAPDASATRQALRGARLLLVEDNAINQELALALLEGEGAAVTVAGDGREAIEVLDAGRFDLVLMDCQMPVMDGYEATRAIRLQPRWRAIPIVAMTANAMAGDRERALAAGMNDHIVKPLDVDAMFATIARWLVSAPPR